MSGDVIGTERKTFHHYRDDSFRMDVTRLEGGQEYECEVFDPIGTLVTAGTVTVDEIDRVVDEWLDEADHKCMDEAVEICTDGPLGHGWECGRCGAFLQAG